MCGGVPRDAPGEKSVDAFSGAGRRRQRMRRHPPRRDRRLRPESARGRFFRALLFFSRSRAATSARNASALPEAAAPTTARRRRLGGPEHGGDQPPVAPHRFPEERPAALRVSCRGSGRHGFITRTAVVRARARRQQRAPDALDRDPPDAVLVVLVVLVVLEIAANRRRAHRGTRARQNLGVVVRVRDELFARLARVLPRGARRARQPDRPAARSAPAGGGVPAPVPARQRGGVPQRLRRATPSGRFPLNITLNCVTSSEAGGRRASCAASKMRDAISAWPTTLRTSMVRTPSRACSRSKGKHAAGRSSSEASPPSPPRAESRRGTPATKSRCSASTGNASRNRTYVPQARQNASALPFGSGVLDVFPLRGDETPRRARISDPAAVFGTKPPSRTTRPAPSRRRPRPFVLVPHRSQSAHPVLLPPGPPVARARGRPRRCRSRRPRRPVPPARARRGGHRRRHRAISSGFALKASSRRRCRRPPRAVFAASAAARSSAPVTLTPSDRARRRRTGGSPSRAPA